MYPYGQLRDYFNPYYVSTEERCFANWLISILSTDKLAIQQAR